MNKSPDIVDQLRLEADTLLPPPIKVLRAAADEIERLRRLADQAMQYADKIELLKAEIKRLMPATELRAEVERLRRTRDE
jgi:hypothetical protein